MVALRHEGIGRLDVAVDETVLVGGIQRGGELRHQRERALGRERPLGREQPLEVDAVDVAHRDEELAAGLARLVDRDDAGVVDRGRRARLPQEPGTERLVVAELRRQHLQRDLATEPHVGREVHDPHATATEDLLDAIPPEVPSDGFGGWLAHVGSETTLPRCGATVHRPSAPERIRTSDLPLLQGPIVLEVVRMPLHQQETRIV